MSVTTQVVVGPPEDQHEIFMEKGVRYTKIKNKKVRMTGISFHSSKKKWEVRYIGDRYAGSASSLKEAIKIRDSVR